MQIKSDGLRDRIGLEFANAAAAITHGKQMGQDSPRESLW